MTLINGSHRRHARNVARFAPPDEDPSTSTDNGDWWTILFPPDTDTATTSSSSSTSLTNTGVIVITDEPFSTTANSDTTTTSTTSSTTLSTTSATVLPSSTTAHTTVMLTVSATSSAASSTTTTAAATNSNTGAIVGGVGAAVLGIAVLCAFVSFLVRRLRRRRDESDASMFDPSSFRKSALLMEDSPTHDDIVAAGFNPRAPPTVMMDQRPVTLGTIYSEYPTGPVYPHPQQHYGYAMTDPANPFYSPINPHQQSPFSPLSASTANPFSDPAHEVQAPVSAPVLTRSPSAGTTLTRSSSSATAQATLTAAEQQDYVTLNRSSVTPFQNAQYVDISKKLDTQPPVGLDTPAVEEAMRNMQTPPPVPEKDIDSVALKGRSAKRPVSGESVTYGLNGIQLNFPAPPSPALTTTSRYSPTARVPSTPPTLPEIQVRNSGVEFPSPAPAASQFSSGVADHIAQSVSLSVNKTDGQFPVTPSPLASSFAITPGPEEKNFEQKHTARHSAQNAAPRPDTLYDADDAYGGI